MRDRQELDLMLARLAGSLDVHPLATFASVLEPIKGYRRHQSRPYDWPPLLTASLTRSSPKATSPENCGTRLTDSFTQRRQRMLCTSETTSPFGSET